MVAAVLALASAAAWGVSDFLGGLTSRAASVLAVALASQGIGLVGIAVVVAAGADDGPTGDQLLFAVLAGLGGAIGLGALYRGMAIGTMSVVAPISATGVAIPVFVGIARGERPSWIQGVGLALALGGVVLASRETGERSARAGLAAGVGLALVAAVAIGVFFAALDAASEDGVLWALFVQRLTLVSLVLAAAAVLRPSLRIGRTYLPAVAAMGVLDLGANALFAVASTRGFVSLVSVLASLYPVVTVLLAHAALGERIASVQRAGVVGALAGVVLITAG